MLEEIGKLATLHGCDMTVSIHDARNYIAASGNKLKSGGFENENYYTNCRVYFNDIPNIHNVRTSF